MSNILRISMIVALVITMGIWHAIARVIVGNYGLVGTAMMFGLIYGIAMIVERREQRLR